MARNSSLLRIFCLCYPADKSAFSCRSVLGMGIAGSTPCANPPSPGVLNTPSTPPRTTSTVLEPGWGPVLSAFGSLLVILQNKLNWRYPSQEGEEFFFLIFHCLPPPEPPPGAVGSSPCVAAGPGGLLAAAQQRGLDCRSRNPSTLRACSHRAMWNAACPLPHCR